MDPPDPTWECFEILLLYIPCNDAWQFAINFPPSAEGHLKMLIYHFCIENADLKPHEKYQCKSFISQFRIKCCGMDPPDPTWVYFDILLLHVLSNDAWKFAISFSPSAEGHLKMLIYFFFVLKMQIWNPMKYINVYLSFLSLGSKVVKWTPLIQHEKVLKFYFCMYCPMIHDNLP